MTRIPDTASRVGTLRLGADTERFFGAMPKQQVLQALKSLSTRCLRDVDVSEVNEQSTFLRCSHLCISQGIGYLKIKHTVCCFRLAKNTSTWIHSNRSEVGSMMWCPYLVNLRTQVYVLKVATIPAMSTNNKSEKSCKVHAAFTRGVPPRGGGSLNSY